MKKKYSSKAVNLTNMSPGMTKQQKDAVERNFEAKAEKHFKSHRELANGRNFTCWNHQHQPEQDKLYRDNYDRIFPNAPGAGM